MKEHYASFTRSFQMWHYRMTPDGHERVSACWLLSIVQAINVVSLAIWLPRNAMPGWAYAIAFFASSACFYFINRPFFARVKPNPSPAKWSDNAPKYREFPSVYN